jgi:hypothetical protein
MMAMLDEFSVLWVYIGTVVLVMVAAEVGYQLGLWLQRRDPDSGKTLLSGPVVGGMLGLMAFLLGFCISIVIGQHNGRKAIVVTEANAIGTAYLRTGFLNETDRNSSRDLLQEYVEVRLGAAADPTLFDSARSRSEAIQNELWSIVENNVWDDQDSEMMALYVESINEVIDVHTLRLAAVDLRLPRQLGIVLYTATVFSFLLVGVSSSANGKRDTLTIFLFALAFVTVFIIIVDLDRAQEGLLTVSQSALSDLLAQMTTSP